MDLFLVEVLTAFVAGHESLSGQSLPRHFLQPEFAYLLSNQSRQDLGCNNVFVLLIRP